MKLLQASHGIFRSTNANNWGCRRITTLSASSSGLSGWKLEPRNEPRQWMAAIVSGCVVPPIRCRDTIPPPFSEESFSCLHTIHFLWRGKKKRVPQSRKNLFFNYSPTLRKKTERRHRCHQRRLSAYRSINSRGSQSNIGQASRSLRFVNARENG